MSEQPKQQQTKPKPKGKKKPAEKEPWNPVFDKRLMRRRWSKKEIVNIIFEELGRNGNLTRKIQEVSKNGAGS